LRDRQMYVWYVWPFKTSFLWFCNL